MNFAILPRFYIICLHKEEKSSEMAESLTELINKSLKEENSPLELESPLTLQKLVPLKFKEYATLGYFEIRLKKIELAAMNELKPEEQTFAIYKTSLALEKLIKEKNATTEHNFFLDEYNPPYIVNIAVESSKENIKWDTPTVENYMKPLGRWIEFYSGQFDDYRRELYVTRIENNISNRESEVHFIRNNSAFIFMPENWWNDRGGSYMEQFFIHQILRVKGLLFSFYKLNLELDEVTNRIQRYDDPPIKLLEYEIEKVSNLEQVVEKMSDRLFEEQIINRRAHGKKVLELSLKLFEIKEISIETKDKLRRLSDQLINARAVQNEKLAKQQRIWLLILNILIGSSVLFEVGKEVNDQLNDTSSYLYDILGADIAKLLLDIYDPLFWIGLPLFWFILGTIGIIGFIQKFLKQKKVISKFQEIST